MIEFQIFYQRRESQEVISFLWLRNNKYLEEVLIIMEQEVVHSLKDRSKFLEDHLIMILQVHQHLDLMILIETMQLEAEIAVTNYITVLLKDLIYKLQIFV